MFVVNDDLSIYATRGDIVCLNVSATDDRTGEPYEFQPGDILQMKIFAKKDAENVVLQKDFPVPAKTNTVGVFLTEQDTRIGEVISKPVDYWYEVTLNPYTNPQTFIGYDEDGAKIFKLFPEGNEVEDDEGEITPEDIPVVDTDLSLLSSRPVQNKAIARAITLVKNDMALMDERLTGKIKANKKAGETVAEELAVERARIDNLVASPTPGDSELVDIRVGADGVTYESAGTAVREQFDTIAAMLTGLGVYGVSLYTLVEGKGTHTPELNGIIDTSGKFAETDTWFATNYIPIDKDTTAIYGSLVGVTTVSSVAFFDEDKAFISGVSVSKNYGAVEGVFEIPDDAKYVRFTFIYSVDTQFVRISKVNTNLIDNHLNGKVITATGDSITAATASNPEWSYVKQIADKNGMVYENKAVWGGVFPKNVVANGSTLPSILETMDSMRADADFIILSGGVNDFTYIHSGTEPYGAISSSYNTELDEGTYCGAFESMLKTAILKWSGKKILYVIEHKMISENSLIGMAIRDTYLPATIQMLKKWGIPYVDLYNDVPPLGLVPELRDSYTWDYDEDGVGDGWHPNKEGYRCFYTPMVEAKLKTI